MSTHTILTNLKPHDTVTAIIDGHIFTMTVVQANPDGITASFGPNGLTTKLTDKNLVTSTASETHHG